MPLMCVVICSIIIKPEFNCSAGFNRACLRELIQGKIGIRFKPIFSAREQILTCQSDAGKKNSSRWQAECSLMALSWMEQGRIKRQGPLYRSSLQLRWTWVSALKDSECWMYTWAQRPKYQFYSQLQDGHKNLLDVDAAIHCKPGNCGDSTENTSNYFR